MKIQQAASRALKNIVKRLFRERGYTIAPVAQAEPALAGLDDRFMRVLAGMNTIGAFEIKQYTTYAAVEHVLNSGIEGDLIECGVYQGRQALMMAETLKARGITDRNIFLYDTFSGQIKPTAQDYKDAGNPEASFQANLARWEQGQITGPSKAWKVATVDEVRAHVYGAVIPRLAFILSKGTCLRFCRTATTRAVPSSGSIPTGMRAPDTSWSASTIVWWLAAC